MQQIFMLKPVRIASARWPRLGQETATATAPAAAPKTPAAATAPPSAAVQEKPAFIDSALVAFGVDVVGAVSAGFVAWAAAKAMTRDGKPAPRTTMALVFGVLAGAAGIKGLVDLGWVRER